jgi:hypothetical protein
MRAAYVGLAILLTAGMAHAQEYLNCHFAPGWEQSGAKRQYTADNLFDYKDGGAEGYLSFGFAKMQGIDCKSGGSTLSIDVSEMRDADAAYGIFTANLDPSVPVAKIGMGGQVMRQSASFAKGKYYVEIAEVAANPDSDDTATMKAFVNAMQPLLEGQDATPETLDWFPKENLTSARLIPESVLGLRELKRGYVAKYKVGQAFILLEASPDSASAVLKQLQERFPGASPAKVGDEAFQAKAQYLDGICFFRKGRYLAGYANLPETADAVSQATLLATRIP